MISDRFQITHIVPSVAEEASGLTYAVGRLCQSLIEQDQDVSLAALDWADMQSRPPYLQTFALGFGPRRLGNSPAMLKWLLENVHDGHIDLIHNHSLWMMPNIYPGQVAKRANIPLIVSPHGTFSEWAMQNGSAVKRLFWPLIQKPSIETAACFHATSETEYTDIRRLGFRQPVCTIPHGIDIPPLPKPIARKRRTLLFLGRIHPIKGVDVLLRAWAVASSRFPDWDLKIVGPDDGGYRSQLLELANELKLQRIEFCGPLYGGDKFRVYAAAELFVLPTHSENFGIAVAEALASGTPVIVTRVAPWSRLEKHRSGWWIDTGVDALTACLVDALACSSEDLAEMGMLGRSWMIADFSWTHAAQQMTDTYRWILQGGDKPSCVIEE